MRKAGEAYSTKERAELLLSNLEKLKAEVSVIEARYNLKGDYAKMCEDAISKISAMKAELEKDIESKIEGLEVFKPDASDLEARNKLGLTLLERFLTQDEVLSEEVTPASGGLQSIVNKVADGIESGLDKMGYGIAFVGEKMASVPTAISKVVNWKAKKRG